jgi:hypothetical protein
MVIFIFAALETPLTPGINASITSGFSQGFLITVIAMSVHQCLAIAVIATKVA